MNALLQLPLAIRRSVTAWRADYPAWNAVLEGSLFAFVLFLLYR